MRLFSHEAQRETVSPVTENWFVLTVLLLMYEYTVGTTCEQRRLQCERSDASSFHAVEADALIHAFKKYWYMPVICPCGPDGGRLTLTPSSGFFMPGYGWPKLSLLIVCVKSRSMSPKGAMSWTCMLPCDASALERDHLRPYAGPTSPLPHPRHLLVRPPRRKVEVPGHLVHLAAVRSSVCSGELHFVLKCQRPVHMLTAIFPHIRHPSPF